jgi:hypothetical protein
MECIAELDALNALPDTEEDEDMASVNGDESSPSLGPEGTLSRDDDLGSGEDVAALDGDFNASLILDHGPTQDPGGLHGSRAAANTPSIDYEDSQASSNTSGPDKPQTFATVVVTPWAIREDNNASLNPDGLEDVQEGPEDLQDLPALEPVALDYLQQDVPLRAPRIRRQPLADIPGLDHNRNNVRRTGNDFDVYNGPW